MSALPACSTRVGWCVSVAVCVCVSGFWGGGGGQLALVFWDKIL